MKIVQFLHHFPRPGGTTTVVAALARAWEAEGHRVVTLGGEGRPGNDGSVGLTGRAQLRGGDQLSSFDVAVLHGMFTPLVAALARRFRSVGLPVFFAPHGAYSSERFARSRVRKRLYWAAIEHRLLENVTGIVVLAPSHVSQLRALAVETPIAVIPNGLQPGWPGEPGREPFGRALYLGRLDVRGKGLDILLQAIKAGPATVAVDLVGPSSPADMRRLVELRSQLGLANRVFIHPRADDPRPWLRQALFTVLPSRSEGFGLVGLESLALGTPLLVSRAAGVSEWFGPGTGCLTHEPTPVQLAGKLEAMQGSRDLLREEARARRGEVLDRFNWGTIAAEWLEFMRNPH